MEVITKSKFMAVLDLEKISIMKITLFPYYWQLCKKIKELNSLLVRVIEPQLSFVWRGIWK